MSNNHGVIFSGGVVESNHGAINITGNGMGQGNYNYGVRIVSGGIVRSLIDAEITIEGTSSLQGDESNCGISIAGYNSSVLAVDGSITLQGVAQGLGSFNQGIRIENGQVISTGTGVDAATIDMLGTGGFGTNYNNGVMITGNLSRVRSVDGNIFIDGTAHGSGIGNDGVNISSSEQVQATGSGVITITSQ